MTSLYIFPRNFDEAHVKYHVELIDDKNPLSILSR